MPHELTDREVVAACAAATAVALGVCAHAGTTNGINRAVRRAIRPKRSPRIVKLAKTVSYLGVPTLHPIVATAASVVISAATGRIAPATAIASIAAFGLDRGARFIVHQKRPPKARKHRGRDRFAYPSGHTAATTAITLTAAIDLGEGRSASDRALLYAAATLCAAVVGWSRLALDEHWIDDVVGGWATGVATAIAVTAGVNATRRATGSQGGVA